MSPGGHTQTSHIELEERNSDPPACDGIPQEKTDAAITAGDVSKKAENKGAESDGAGPAGQISDSGHADDDVENPNRPKGFSFAVVYTCILFGDFFTGYVGVVISNIQINAYFTRTQAVLEL
jgi:hypothetical protein